MSYLVAGSTGLAGSAITRFLKNRGLSVIEINRKILNLYDRTATREFINDLKPIVVIDAAALVGGIGANNRFPVDFLSGNLQIQLNLMDACHEAKVERFVFLGSSCIYPKYSEQPIKEEYLMSGPLEETNSAYAIAKISGIELVKAYRKQYGHKWISLMPTNLYGPNDNFDIENGHVLPALINKFVTSKENHYEEVTLWGSGKPRREFLHADDLASAIFVALEKYDDSVQLNIGSGNDVSIFELSETIKNSSGFQGKVNWDKSKPDGTPRKLLDITKLKKLGWEQKINLLEGIDSTISWFKSNREKALSRKYD